MTMQNACRLGYFAAAILRGLLAACVLPCLCMAAEPAAAVRTPIRHLIVIYQENVSFDHYFATYPHAANLEGERPFPAIRAPSVNGLSGPLLARNPNSRPPFRLPPSHAATCDQDHSYLDEQRAYDLGLVDRVVEFEGTGARRSYGQTACDAGDVMGYFDGNTVAALWMYAHRFALADNFFGTTFGPSTVGALNLVAGQTHGANGDCGDLPPEAGCVATADGLSFTGRDSVEILDQTIIGDPQPAFDECSTRERAAMSGTNVGDLLTKKHVLWGFFQGGFRPSGHAASGRAQCGTAHPGSAGGSVPDYIPHHEPFQYYRSTANPGHLPPTRADLIGSNEDAANHQYDLEDFWSAATAGRLPEVAFLKAPAYQDGHAGYSDPLREQQFLVETINRLQRLREWRDMAIVIAYDDSDGWYDHVMPPIVRGSAGAQDAVSGERRCGQPGAAAVTGRCGYGPRLPLLVLSPWVRPGFVEHRLLDQASILRFIEDNWRLGRLGAGSADEEADTLDEIFDWAAPPRWNWLLLDPVTGERRHEEQPLVPHR